LKNLSLSDHITAHCQQCLESALSAQRHPAWKLSCPELSDADFTCFGLLRCLSTIDSGHHFLQVMDDVHQQPMPVSTYFNALKSSRRADMLEAVEQQSYQRHCEQLQNQGIDYLASFPELAHYTVEAADGHFIEHACHTEKNTKGTVYAAGFIYALNLRNGLIRPLCPITNGTRRNQEIPVLRRALEKHKPTQQTGQKYLYVYDKAVTDYRWWNGQKSRGNVMISMLKENASVRLIEAIPFRHDDPVNTGALLPLCHHALGVRQTRRDCDFVL